jgi:hypothetical protein
MTEVRTLTDEKLSALRLLLLAPFSLVQQRRRILEDRPNLRPFGHRLTCLHPVPVHPISLALGSPATGCAAVHPTSSLPTHRRALAGPP